MIGSCSRAAGDSGLGPGGVGRPLRWRALGKLIWGEDVLELLQLQLQVVLFVHAGRIVAGGVEVLDRVQHLHFATMRGSKEAGGGRVRRRL